MQEPGSPSQSPKPYKEQLLDLTQRLEAISRNLNERFMGLTPGTRGSGQHFRWYQEVATYLRTCTLALNGAPDEYHEVLAQLSDAAGALERSMKRPQEFTKRLARLKEFSDPRAIKFPREKPDIVGRKPWNAAPEATIILTEDVVAATREALSQRWAVLNDRYGLKIPDDTFTDFKTAATSIPADAQRFLANEMLQRFIDHKYDLLTVNKLNEVLTALGVPTSDSKSSVTRALPADYHQFIVAQRKIPDALKTILELKPEACPEFFWTIERPGGQESVPILNQPRIAYVIGGKELPLSLFLLRIRLALEQGIKGTSVAACVVPPNELGELQLQPGLKANGAILACVRNACSEDIRAELEL